MKFSRSQLENYKNIVKQKRDVSETVLLNARNILYLAPHPDDEIIGCGGNLIYHRDKGQYIYGCYLTNGCNGINDPQISSVEAAKIRKGELELVSMSLCVEQIEYWNIDDLSLKADEATIQRMEELLIKVKPDLIYTPSLFENHPDHYATTLILLETLKRLNEQKNDWFLDVMNSSYILLYNVWDATISNVRFNISPYWEEKKRLLNLYSSQKQYHIIDLAEYNNQLEGLRQNSTIDCFSESYYKVSLKDMLSRRKLFKELKA